MDNQKVICVRDYLDFRKGKVYEFKEDGIMDDDDNVWTNYMCGVGLTHLEMWNNYYFGLDGHNIFKPLDEQTKTSEIKIEITINNPNITINNLFNDYDKVEVLKEIIIEQFSKDEIERLFQLIYDDERNGNSELMSISDINLKNPFSFIDGGTFNAMERDISKQDIINKLMECVGSVANN